MEAFIGVLQILDLKCIPQVPSRKSLRPRVGSPWATRVPRVNKPQRRACPTVSPIQTETCVAKTVLCSFFSDLQVGGWLLLAIVLAGAVALVITHMHGIWKVKRTSQCKQPPSPVTWAEARYHSRVARFV